MEVLRCFVRINKKIKSLLFDFFIPKNEDSNTLVVYGSKKEWEDMVWLSFVPKNTIFVEEIVINSKKICKIWNPDQLFVKTSKEKAYVMLNKKPFIPWLWIGSNENEEITNKLEEFMVVGNIITLELLKDLCPCINKFQYLCPSTLELQDFPIGGIQIKEDDSFNENSKKTS